MTSQPSTAATSIPQPALLAPHPQSNGVYGSPERRSQPSTNGQRLSFDTFAAPASPSKGLAASPSKASIGPASSPLGLPPQPAFNQYYPQPVQRSSSALQDILSGNPLSSHRPSSSHSIQSQAHPSPIQNRPSMSPTQGNRDVGPLAGFPHSTPANGSVPSTPYGQHMAARPQAPLSSSFDRRTSFSESFAAATPPPGPQNVALSGLSPTKNNSPRPVTAGSGMGSATSILPPIHRLEPSPKLMGRSSADAPIPPPVKMMTPEQEERRQRENQAQAAAGLDPGSRASLPPLASWNVPPDVQRQ